MSEHLLTVSTFEKKSVNRVGVYAMCSCGNWVLRRLGLNIESLLPSVFEDWISHKKNITHPNPKPNPRKKYLDPTMANVGRTDKPMEPDSHASQYSRTFPSFNEVLRKFVKFCAIADIKLELLSTRIGEDMFLVRIVDYELLPDHTKYCGIGSSFDDAFYKLAVEVSSRRLVHVKTGHLITFPNFLL